MKFNFDYRDPLHLSTFIFSSISIIITMSLFFILLLQTLLHQLYSLGAGDASNDVSWNPEQPWTHSDQQTMDAHFPLVNHRQRYNIFKKSLFQNKKNNICNPDNSTASQLTRDKFIIPVHSHNDYWRALPVFDALSYGSNSIEADIWLSEPTTDESVNKNGKKLLVGHNQLYLTPANTVESLYLHVLNDLLDEVNCDAGNNIDVKKPGTRKNGFFYNSPHTTTFLYIDIKTEAVETYKKFIETVIHTTSLIKKDYLTYYKFGDNNDGALVWGPLTLVITGNAPHEFMKNEKLSDPFSLNKRIAFVDAPLLDIATGVAGQNRGSFNNDESLAVIGSASLHQLINDNSRITSITGLSDDQVAVIKQTVDASHKLNIKTRIWDTPDWPVYVRYAVWQQLLDAGVDYLNVDDLKDARLF